RRRGALPCRRESPCRRALRCWCRRKLSPPPPPGFRRSAIRGRTPTSRSFSTRRPNSREDPSCSRPCSARACRPTSASSRCARLRPRNRRKKQRGFREFPATRQSVSWLSFVSSHFQVIEEYFDRLSVGVDSDASRQVRGGVAPFDRPLR